MFFFADDIFGEKVSFGVSRLVALPSDQKQKQSIP